MPVLPSDMAKGWLCRESKQGYLEECYLTSFSCDVVDYLSV